MPGPLLHVGAQATCPHSAGQITAIPSSPRVYVGGQPVVTVADQFVIAGCPFTVANKPQPCMKVQWVVPATRVQVNGSPALLQNSVGLCLSADQIPAGPPTVLSVQTRAVGT
jgi:uncharacterized Zn-binding protein involved in type VI secretion